MGTARSTFFTIASSLMIFSGIGSLILAAALLAERWGNIHSSPFILAAIGLLMVIASILNIITGISGLASSNRRTNFALIIRLPEVSLLLCLITLILAFFNGILLWQIGALLLLLLIVPLVFIFAAVKKSYMS